MVSLWKRFNVDSYFFYSLILLHITEQWSGRVWEALPKAQPRVRARESLGLSPSSVPCQAAPAAVSSGHYFYFPSCLPDVKYSFFYPQINLQCLVLVNVWTSS